MSEAIADIAVVGMGPMGKNFILNINDNGFKVVAANRYPDEVDAFLETEAKGTGVIGARSFPEMVQLLKRPRRIMLLIRAGAPVEETINLIVPHLDQGDIIIDGGNSEYTDSNRRYEELKIKGIHFVGCGVSGGEEGARYGPSLMPGGAPEAWPHLEPIFERIAAKVDGEPCFGWLGNAGSGHFVKMVHNGIEYGDMQLIAEAYHLLHESLGLSYDELADTFLQWNQGELDSFLIEITANILKYRDEQGECVVPKILDSAGQKGTGKWTGIAALEYGQPVTLIAESVFARCLSALKDQRVAATKVLPGSSLPRPEAFNDKKAFIEHVRLALYASKIVSYAQGFMLLSEASKIHGWNLNFGAIALMWRGGCIIRSRFLGRIKEAFDTNPNLQNLLLDDFFKSAVNMAQHSWRIVVSAAVEADIPMPAFTSALSFFDGYRDVSPLTIDMFDIVAMATSSNLPPPNNWSGETGHEAFINMVHSGIEYGNAQLINEACKMLSELSELTDAGIRKTLLKWNNDYNSQLNHAVLNTRNNDVQCSGVSKEFGKWASIAGLEYGQPLTLVSEAVFARCLAETKNERLAASKMVSNGSAPRSSVLIDKAAFIEHVRKSLEASVTISYAQGIMLLSEANKFHNWGLNIGGIIGSWRQNCLLLDRIQTAFNANPSLENILLDDYFLNSIHIAQTSWRRVVASAIQVGISIPATSSSLAFYNGYRSKVLPANLLQAQRDYFGAHCYQLLSDPETNVHTNWTSVKSV